MNYVSKIYNLDNLKELKAMEKEQQRLYKKYPSVKVVQVGFNQYRLVCSML